MPNDYLKKQPSKAEKLIHELYLHTDRLSRSLWTTTSFVTALAYIQKVKPEEIAKLLTAEHQKIKEYSDQVNKTIAEIEKKQKEETAAKAPEEK